MTLPTGPKQKVPSIPRTVGVDHDSTYFLLDSLEYDVRRLIAHPAVQMSKTWEFFPTDRLTSSFQELVGLQSRGSVEDIVVGARKKKDSNSTKSLKIVFSHQRAVVVVENSLTSTTAGEVL